MFLGIKDDIKKIMFLKPKSYPNSAPCRKSMFVYKFGYILGILGYFGLYLGIFGYIWIYIWVDSKTSLYVPWKI